MSDVSRQPNEDLLTGVLGPDKPELSCEECFAQLDLYTELALAGEPVDELVPGMRAHLEGCPACAEDFDALRNLLLGLREGRRTG